MDGLRVYNPEGIYTIRRQRSAQFIIIYVLIYVVYVVCVVLYHVQPTTPYIHTQTQGLRIISIITIINCIGATPIHISVYWIQLQTIET